MTKTHLLPKRRQKKFHNFTAKVFPFYSLALITIHQIFYPVVQARGLKIDPNGENLISIFASQFLINFLKDTLLFCYVDFNAKTLQTNYTRVTDNPTWKDEFIL